MPASDLSLLTEAARAAGKIALRHWRTQPRAWEKPDGTGPVTEADIAVNAMLHATLTVARPDHGWLSEESIDTAARLGAPRIFIIDPIDGTRAFIAAEEHFAHSLAIADHGRITAAVVYLPALDQLFAATATSPATLNGEPIRTSAMTDLAQATVLASRPNFEPQHWPGGVPDIRRAFRASLAYRLCLVAQGRFDAMLTFRDTWEWDVAAGDLIVRQAGGTVTDRHRAPLRYNTQDPRVKGVIAAGPAAHAALSAHL